MRAIDDDLAIIHTHKLHLRSCADGAHGFFRIVNARQLNGDAVFAFQTNVRLGDTETVDAVVDDGDGAHHVFVGGAFRRFQTNQYAPLQIEPEIGVAPIHRHKGERGDHDRQNDRNHHGNSTSLHESIPPNNDVIKP